MNRGHLSLLAVLQLILLPSTLRGAEVPRAPVSVTVSGGVSLGSYEAGYLYYSSRFLRENNLKLGLKLTTGASAGAINSFLSIMSACSTEQFYTPSESLFWRTWMPVGWKSLLGTPARQKASSAFTTEALEQSAVGIEAEWMKGFDKNCDVVLGVATTLLKPEQLKVTQGIQAQHQEEPFVLRIRGRGKGVAPLITNYVDPRDATPHAQLFLPADDRGRFLALQSLLLASAAFPLAFPPVKLKICRTDLRHPENGCAERDAHEEYFIDGGVFDNEPLRLAARIAARGLKKVGPSFVWEDVPGLKRQSPPRELRFKAIDVDSKTYPSEAQVAEKNVAEEDAPVVGYFEKFVFRFVTSARAQQLYSVLDENPDLVGAIQSSINHFPLASAPALAFTGFFDRGFREIDFYMGMYDAQKVWLSAKENQGRTFTLPETAGGENLEWRTFSCLKAVLDHSADQTALCARPEMAQTRKLLQLSLDVLYNDCRGLDPKSDLSAFPNEDCVKAAHGAAPPRVAADTNTDEWQRHSDETEGLYAFRILAQNHYHFELIDDANATPREVLTAMKGEVRAAFGKLADRQPPSDRFLLNFVGEPAFNLISYSPPTREYHVLLGELVEGGGSLALSDGVRAHAAITLRRPQDVFSHQYGDFALAGMIGIEGELKSLSSAIIQPRLGARAGYQFTPRDSWGGGVCIAGDDCTRWVAEPYLSVTVYERLRLQVVEQILPPAREQPISFNSFIQLGIEATP